jgi:phosphoglycerate-specific signal transduction histidine kinase
MLATGQSPVRPASKLKVNPRKQEHKKSYSAVKALVKVIDPAEIKDLTNERQEKAHSFAKLQNSVAAFILSQNDNDKPKG